MSASTRKKQWASPIDKFLRDFHDHDYADRKFGAPGAPRLFPQLASPSPYLCRQSQARLRLVQSAGPQPFGQTPGSGSKRETFREYMQERTCSRSAGSMGIVPPGDAFQHMTRPPQPFVFASSLYDLERPKVSPENIYARYDNRLHLLDSWRDQGKATSRFDRNIISEPGDWVGKDYTPPVTAGRKRMVSYDQNKDVFEQPGVRQPPLNCNYDVDYHNNEEVGMVLAHIVPFEPGYRTKTHDLTRVNELCARMRKVEIGIKHAENMEKQFASKKAAN